MPYSYEYVNVLCARRQVIGQSREHRRTILDYAAKNLRTWAIRIRKMKAIYHTLNLFATPTGSYALPAPNSVMQQQQLLQQGAAGSTSSKDLAAASGGAAPRCLVGEGWCPTRDLDAIRFALRRGTVRHSAHSCFAIIMHSTYEYMFCEYAALLCSRRTRAGATCRRF